VNNKFGLLGQKLSHSFSPAIHAEFGGYDYALFEVEPENLAEFMNSSPPEGYFHGINVTIPYKQAVMQFCTKLSPAAKAIGSVNTIVRTPDGGLLGDNTDAAGFCKMLSACAAKVAGSSNLHSQVSQKHEAGRMFVRGKKAIVFGSHGSSLSICYVLRNFGASEVVVVAIEDNNQEFLRNHKDAEILVNCTPVGMYPHTGPGEPPIKLELFPNLTAVLDIVYNPARTWLMMDAEERGIPAIGGLTMLVGQAAVSSEIFTGREVEENKILSIVKKLSLNTQNIILIGMPGSGKTTHSRIIAEKLGRKFIDTDEEIESATGCTIPEIFAKEGESGFRKHETEILKKFCKESGLVIATGGGCITREENYRHLHQNGVIIFTERNINNLAREGRPLSQGDLHAMYKVRLPLYRRFADIIVNADENPQTLADRIISAVIS